MKEPTKSFGFRLPAETLEKLRYIASFDCRSASSMIRVLIYDCVEEFEKEHGEILFSRGVDIENVGE